MVKFALAILAVLGLAACSEDSGTPTKPPPQGSQTRTVVQVRNNFFSPQDVTVSQGDTVVWFNGGSAGHTTTSGTGCAPDGLWDSGFLSGGGSFEVIFDATHVSTTGTIPYYCEPHCNVGMVGTVTVNP